MDKGSKGVCRMKSNAWLIGLLFVSLAACREAPAGAEPVQHIIQHGGLERHYLLSVPPAARYPNPPLVLLLHGATGSAEQVWGYTALPKLAAEHGFVLLAPDGIKNRWNDGRAALLLGERSVADDVGFLVALIRTMIAEQHVNPQQVYIVGISNGAMLTYRMLCEHGDLFAAAAPVIATLPEAQAVAYPAKPVVPIILTLGTADPLLPWAGGMNTTTGVTMLSGTQTFDFFLKRAACHGNTQRNLPDVNPKDGSTVTQFDGTACQQPVRLLQVNQGGHQWLNGKGGWWLRQLLGPANRDVDGAEAIWSFFRTQQRP
jgi:polyhydroxybutyrate depolymerase